ncbi:MAG: choice-of-anchor Q domain-containing protein [Thermoanaerobaculia bacterium]
MSCLAALCALAVAMPAARGAGELWRTGEWPVGDGPIVVNSLADGTPADDSQCTLREAMLNVIGGDQSGSLDCISGEFSLLIRFDVPDGTIELASALPVITTAMIIEGPGADRLTVRRDAGGNYPIFEVPSGSSAILRWLTIANGSAPDGGGIRNAGQLIVENSVLTGNSSSTMGGAIHNTGQLTVRSSTIHGNSAADGAALADLGPGGAVLTNVTIDGNTASATVGGILVLSTDTVASVTLVDCTVSDNTGPATGAALIAGGDTGGSLTFGNTILDGNSTPSLGAIPLGVILSEGHNLASDSANGLLTDPTDVTGTSAKLGPLALYGGSTPTRELSPGSPAVDAGDCSIAMSGTDQRGVGRPQAGSCDIGAFERAPVTVAGYWPLREGGGSVAHELSGASVDGAITGLSWVTDPQRGMVLQFPGGSGFVHVPDFVTELATAEFTIAAWVKIESGAAGGLFCKGDGDRTWEEGEKQFWFGDGSTGGDGERPSFVGFGNDYAISGNDFPTSGWHHLAMTWRPAPGPGVAGASQWTYFVDGVEQPLVLESYTSSVPDDPTAGFFIGWDGSEEALHDFLGRVSDVAVFSSALDGPLVRRVMNGDLSESSNVLFHDGFETGDTSAW